MNKRTVVAVSGGFDPLHDAHIDYLEAAKKLGDNLVVILNCDAWLKRKKGYVFMDQSSRAHILRSLRCVDEVIIYETKEDDVSYALAALKPDIFAKGGDRFEHNTPESETCQKLGIKMEFGVGGGKARSSQVLVRSACECLNKEKHL